MPFKLTIEEVKDRLSKYNIKLIGDYIDSNTKTLLLCYCGKLFKSEPHSIFGGKTKSCGCLNIQRSQERIKNKVGIKYNQLLVLERLPKTKNFIYYLCLCDCGKETIVRGTQLIDGHTKSCGCLQRKVAASKIGDKHHNYNPNLTSEDRIKRRLLPEYKKWSKEILQRDKHTCQICKQKSGKLNAHHLDGWGWCKEKRFYLDNGITLCNNCHDKFHNQYGRGDNTKQQFEEYIQTIYKNLGLINDSQLLPVE